jgi:hypothetical protein
MRVSARGRYMQLVSARKSPWVAAPFVLAFQLLMPIATESQPLCKSASDFVPDAIASWECLAPISSNLSAVECESKGCSIVSPCDSDNDWVDVYGSSCDDYTDFPEWCQDAAYWGSGGFDASQVCCTCGGSRNGTEHVSYCSCSNASTASDCSTLLPGAYSRKWSVAAVWRNSIGDMWSHP